MGYDITAYKKTKKEVSEEKYYSEENKVAYHRAYMGGFKMCREQGYDWFDLIDANDCDGHVSGNGTIKPIKLTDLKYALKILLSHDIKGKLSSEGRDEFTDRKPLLGEFMNKCIKYCEDNNTESITISFQ